MMKTREDIRIVQLEFFKTVFFGHILKNEHIHFLVHGHSSWSHIRFTISEGSKAFVNY